MRDLSEQRDHIVVEVHKAFNILEWALVATGYLEASEMSEKQISRLETAFRAVDKFIREA